MAKKNETAKTTSGIEYDQETGEIIDALPEGTMNEYTESEHGGGFPPYWLPGIGKKIKATPLYIDMTNPNTFARVVLRADMVITCQRGSRDEGRFEKVQPGEKFTMSIYDGLDLEPYAGESIVIEVLDKQDLKSSDNTWWVWEVHLTPEQKRLAAMRRAEIEGAKMQPGEFGKRPPKKLNAVPSTR